MKYSNAVLELIKEIQTKCVYGRNDVRSHRKRRGKKKKTEKRVELERKICIDLVIKDQKGEKEGRLIHK